MLQIAEQLDIRSGQVGMGMCVSAERRAPAIGPYVCVQIVVSLVPTDFSHQ